MANRTPDEERQFKKFNAGSLRKLRKRPTGKEIFDGMTPEEQDAKFGPAAAELLRNREAQLADFVERDGRFIRQKPAEDVE